VSVVADTNELLDEGIVYFYVACDRTYFYPRLARDQPPSFRDRFTDAVFQPGGAQIVTFCERTLANELDVALPDQESYLARYGRYTLPLFRSERFRERSVRRHSPSAGNTLDSHA
jgi:hypothetical protein